MSKLLVMILKLILLMSPLVWGPSLLRADSTGTAPQAEPGDIKVEAGDIVWSGEDVTGQQIYFTSYHSDKAAWSSPAKVTDDAYRNGHPVIDADQNGKKWLVWIAGSSTDYLIHYAVSKGDGWSVPATIPLQLKVNLAPSVAVDASGAPWVAWSANDGGQDEIYCATYAAGEWTPLMQVNARNRVPDILPKITIDTERGPLVTWQGFRDGSYVRLQSTWNGESWAEEEVVLSETEDSTPAVYRAVVNMPSFIAQPEQAYLRVYASSRVK